MRGLAFFSLTRFRAMVIKEFIQMRRDRVTFGMMIGIPLIQLTLFGFAINSDPKHLPTAVIANDHGPMGRTVLQSLKNSGYFEVNRLLSSEEAGRRALAQGDVQFVVNIPQNFTRDVVRGDSPTLLIEADATDPSATGNALGSMRNAINNGLRNDLKGSLGYLTPGKDPVDIRIHAMYNPEIITQYNIVPGLMGVVLTMTMVVIAGLGITRESESGTMENLLSMPTRPLEVLVGKIVPYILVGYIQIALILLASRFIFNVPIYGNLILLLVVALVFIAANLAIGITISSIARNQRQAMQMAMFFFLPSMLLSGFMFPFRGMPGWAQVVGEILPLTHFLRIVRGILLKGNGILEVSHEIWQIALFVAIVLTLAVSRYKRTLD